MEIGGHLRGSEAGKGLVWSEARMDFFGTSSLAERNRAGKCDVSLLVPRPVWIPRRSQPVKAVPSNAQSVST